MFAVGHLALAYLAGKASSKALKVRVNIALIFALGILPDIDLLIPAINHRQVTHSIIVISLLFLPLFLSKRRRKTSIPYFVAIIQHIFADFLTFSTIQLLWPISRKPFGLLLPLPIDLTSEWVLFLGFTIVMLYSGDLDELLKWKSANLFLVIPIGSIGLPLFLGFPVSVPAELYIPHFILLIIFTFLLPNAFAKKIRNS